MKRPSIYLCGSITGLSYEECVGWREYVTKNLHPSIATYSPMRHKEYLKKEADIADSYEKHILSTRKAITTRDRFDTFRADLLIANFLKAKIVSIGSMIEFGWADAKRIPIIAVMEKNNVHRHGMVEDIASWIVEDLDEAIYVANRILTLDSDALTDIVEPMLNVGWPDNVQRREADIGSTF